MALGRKIMIISIVGLFLTVILANPATKLTPQMLNLYAKHIDWYMESEKRVQKQIDCIQKKGYCDTIGKLIKELIPKALKDDCKECQPQEKEMVDKVKRYMEVNKPDVYKQVLKDYAEKNKAQIV